MAETEEATQQGRRLVEIDLQEAEIMTIGSTPIQEGKWGQHREGPEVILEANPEAEVALEVVILEVNQEVLVILEATIAL